MKFLLDMGLAQSTAAFLRTYGYDAIHLPEEGLRVWRMTRLLKRPGGKNRAAENTLPKGKRILSCGHS